MHEHTTDEDTTHDHDHATPRPGRSETDRSGGNPAREGSAPQRSERSTPKGDRSSDMEEADVANGEPGATDE
jgi:hypothetical protein